LEKDGTASGSSPADPWPANHGSTVPNRSNFDLFKLVLRINNWKLLYYCWIRILRKMPTKI
jgi:hypothetical protein